MALVFNQFDGENQFEVRTAGASVRLYSNGVLHSQYNPRRPISGAIWDLLVLPGFFLNQAPKHVLILGLGGGSVVHLIRYFFPECKMVCVEREAEHIGIAKRFFNIPNDIQLVHGDAYDFLAQTKLKFDWILDDVFQHASGEPEREVSFDRIFPHYEKALCSRGVLSMNTIGSAQLKQLKMYKRRFDQAYVLRHPLYDNGIVTLIRNGRTKTEFFAELLTHKELDTRRKTCALQVNMKVL